MSGPNRSWLIAGAAAVLIAVPVGFATLGGDDNASATPMATATAAPAATVGGLAIYAPKVTVTTTDIAAAYFTVRNSGSADRLVGVSSPVTPDAQLHTTVTNGSSSSMKKVDNFDIPANGTLAFSPGANHIMLLDLNRTLKTGDTVELDLTFAGAGTVRVLARVESLGGR